MPTLGDVFRAYIKPSLGGALILRKKNTIQTSARVAASKERVRRNPPARGAHDALVARNVCPVKRAYAAGRGYEERPICPMKLMIPELRAGMRRAHGAGV